MIEDFVRNFAIKDNMMNYFDLASVGATVSCFWYWICGGYDFEMTSEAMTITDIIGGSCDFRAHFHPGMSVQHDFVEY